MEITNDVWKFFQEHLGYSEEDMKIFREDPRNEHVIKRSMALMNKTVVAEVVESHGCNSQHKVGDTFQLDAFGNLISKKCPKRMCLLALHALTPAVSVISELLAAGVDPNEMPFNRIGCPDVGLNCGGWGRIVLEVKVQERQD